jgi:hypothetical protein
LRFTEWHSRKRRQQQIIAVDPGSAEVIGDDLGNWNGRAAADQGVQRGFLAHHPLLVEQETDLVRRSKAQHKSPLVGVDPVGCIVLAGANGCESERFGVGSKMRGHNLGERCAVECLGH